MAFSGVELSWVFLVINKNLCNSIYFYKIIVLWKNIKLIKDDTNFKDIRNINILNYKYNIIFLNNRINIIFN